MSALGSPPINDSMKTYMLRSSTPASNEKVMLYLESMQSAPPDNEDMDRFEEMPPSEVGSRVSKTRSQASRKSRSQVSRSQVSRREPGVETIEEIRSDMQEQSEAGKTVPIHSDAAPNQDPHFLLPEDYRVRKKFESYQTDQTWGNSGPIPGTEPRVRDKFQSKQTIPTFGFTGSEPPSIHPSDEAPVSPPGQRPDIGQPWSPPITAAGIGLPPSVASPISSRPHNPFQEYGMTSAFGESSPYDPIPIQSNGHLSPKAASRAMSPGRSAATTRYPPLPDSTMSPGRTLSPNAVYDMDRRITKTPSIAPSESASQVPKARREREREREPSVKPVRSEVEAQPRSGSGGGSRGERSRVEGSNAARSQVPPPMSPPPRSQVPAPMSPPQRSQVPSAMSPPPRSQATAPPQPMLMPMSPRSQATAPPPRQMSMSPRSQASRPSNVPPPQILSPARSNRTIPPSAIAAANAYYNAQSPEPVPVPPADPTPTQSRPASPDQELTHEEQNLVNGYFTTNGGLRPTATPGTMPMDMRTTSYAPSAMAPSTLGPDVVNSHYHDGELCQLLHALDQPMAEPVKKAVRKAVRTRIKKLGMKYDNKSIEQYRRSYHDHDPSVHLSPPPAPAAGPDPQVLAAQIAAASVDETPAWARNLLDNVIHLTAKVDQVDTKVDRVVELRSSRGGGSVEDSQRYDRRRREREYVPSQSEMNQTMTQQQTVLTEGDDDMYTEPRHDQSHLHMHHPQAHLHDEEDYYEDDEGGPGTTQLEAEAQGDISGLPSDYSPGQQFLEEELYKLRVKPHNGAASQSGATHKTWEVARDDGGDFHDEGDTQAAVTESGLPEIPDAGGAYTERSLPPLPSGVSAAGPQDEQLLHPQWPTAYPSEQQGPPPWQRIHSRLLSWAIVWPMSELDHALNSTTRGHQVDEVALSIWSTQSYKRYVRTKMTESPPERVDRLFVPPNMAEAISTAVYNGRHGDACGMLRDLWAPFGLEGIPRLLIVLAKHRTDDNHWVVHRFSLPDGSLTTYDTYPDKSLPDGRPLGWWFAIRLAWPDTVYPNPERLIQKMVRLHRPMQLPIDNSVAAAGIWRNLLMGSRAERSLDLERLRDLINQEVKNLRQRKVLGKLSVSSPRPNWEDMH
ncbi:hypothetical protein PsYK624_111130 [Phanerochaete sordida]|uniref:Uncharacterized protein n=1 Tax=Phanerochaete sordida TaxID=48140 RepID=A0A9P3GH85_9APHY|nr:hypothetical protein PsYK624_111130 [Phanerochaete sordida]